MCVCSLSTILTDSDNLGEVRELIGHVLDSDVVVLLQSEEVLTRPWCLLELYTAAAAGIPIVSLVCSGKGYDFAAAEDHLLHLDTSLPAANPSAVGVLEANETSVLHVAQVLWTCLPNVTTVPLNSSGSEGAFRTAVADLVQAMQCAHAMPVPSGGVEAWLADRSARDGAVLAGVVVASSGLHRAQRGRMLKRIERADALEREVTELNESVADLKSALALALNPVRV